jgi:hypothetical protein
MAKQTVDIGQAPNDGTGDPLRVAMDKINDNTNEIYRAVGGLGSDTLLNMVNTDQELQVLNVHNKISFLLDTEADLYALSAGTYHGCIAHVHSTGALYYAHGQWRKLLTDNANNDVTSYADSLANVAYTGLLTDANNAGFGLLNLEDISAGTDGEVLTANSTGGFTFEAPTTGVNNIGELQDVNISTPSSGQVLSYDGTAWVNGTAASGGANTFNTIQIAGQTDIVADSLTDTLTLIAGAGMTITANSVSDEITFVSTATGGTGGAANTFGTIAVAGQPSVVADSTADTLNLIAGTNITIQTDTGTDSITINSTGGYSDANVDTHLNQSTASTNDVLSWNGSDYAWVAQSGGGGGFTPSRVTQAVTTASLVDDAEDNIDFANLGVSYSLYSVQVDKGARVRIYKDDASRTADASRAIGTDPIEGDGVIAEFVASGAETFAITPAIFGYVDNRPTENDIPVRVTNRSGTTGTVTVTITGLKLENA